MRWGSLIAAVILTGTTVLCAGCGREVVASAANSHPTVAVSAIPRTITWKTPPPTAKPSAQTPTAHASATPSAVSSTAGSLSAAVSALIQADNYHVAVAVDDLDTGQVASDEGSEQFITASIAKADILSTLLYQSQDQGGLSSNEQALAKNMIEHSDNKAATSLYEDAGGASAIDAANVVFGLHDTSAGTDGYWGLTTTTAEDQVRLLLQIFTSQSVLSETSREYIQGLMGEVESDQAWGVPAAADDGTSFAVKNGWLPDPTTHLWEVNSIGEVTHDGHQMLIAVLSTDNDDYADGIALVQEIASKAAAAVS